MAKNDIKFNIRLQVDGKDQVVQASMSTKELANNIGNVSKQGKFLTTTLLKFNQITEGVRSFNEGLQSVVAVTKQFSEAAAEQVTRETQLSTVMQQRMKASQDDIDGIKRLTAAQQQLGVIGDEVQLAGAQQIATFITQKSSLEALIPAMNNLLAQQKGLSATGQDAVNIGNLIGKAMQGQTSALRRVGITFDEAQDHMMKFGTESQRAATLAQIITDNVGNMNAQLAQTDAGRVKQMANAFGDLQEKIGFALEPFEGFITQVGQVGFAITALTSVGTGLSSIVVSISKLSVVTKIEGLNARVAAAAQEKLVAALGTTAMASTATTVAVKALTWALRALEVASIVGTVFAVASAAVSLFGDASEDAATDAKNLTAANKETTQSFEEQKSQALAPILAKYKELQAKWEQLKTTQQKDKFIKSNTANFQQLGVGISSVAQAEDFFVKNTNNVVAAMTARAEAAAATALAEQKMREALEAQDKAEKLNQKNREKLKDQHRTGHSSIDATYDALVDNGTIRATSREQKRAEQQARQARREAEHYTRIAANASGRTSALNRYPTGVTMHTASTSKYTGTKAGHVTSDTLKLIDNPKSVKDATNNLRYYEEALEKVNATDVKQVEALLEKKKAAQDLLDYYKSLTNKENKAAATPVGTEKVDKNSFDYKSNFYDETAGKMETVRRDYEIGLIGADTALDTIKELNNELEELGLKPIDINIDTKNLDKAKEKLYYATDAVGQFGGSLSSLGDALKLPELNAAGVLAQAIATMVQGYATATEQAGTMGPWAWIAFAATGLAQLAAMVSSVKGMGAFADGGVVSGPTLALVGEYSGASNNPEVIAPLDKLRSMIGGTGTTGGNVSFEIQGRNLVGVLSNETRAASKSGRRTNIKL